MSKSAFYTPAQRALQDEFDSRALADRLEAAIVTPALSIEQCDFIHARNMFFLSTIDEDGFPSSSYKGGAIGFARCIDNQTLVFPSFDGNGMFMSMGNISASVKVGLLFIDFETPQRLRVRGEAKLLREGPVLDSYPGAELAVEVIIERVWQNCPRYVHKMQSVEPSPHVPLKDGTVRFALWKRIDAMQDVLNESDRAEAMRLGLITGEAYQEEILKGESL